MSEQPTAKTLMKGNFLRLGAGHTLRETLSILLDPAARPTEHLALIAIGDDGKYAGALSPRVFIRALEADDPAEADLMEETLGEQLGRQAPVVSPQTTLAELALLASAHPHEEFFPVLKDDEVEGVVHAGDIFRAVAELVLTPETSGIRLSGGS